MQAGSHLCCSNATISGILSTLLVSYSIVSVGSLFFSFLNYSMGNTGSGPPPWKITKITGMEPPREAIGATGVHLLLKGGQCDGEKNDVRNSLP